MVYLKRGLQNYNAGAVDVMCRFQLNGSSDPTGLVGEGVKSVVHSSTGVYTLTLDRVYDKLLFADASLGLRNAGDSDAVIGRVAVNSNPATVQIITLTSGSAADIAADGYGDNAVSVRLVLKEKKAP